MKTVAFCELDQKDIAVSEVSVICQTPLWSALGGLDDGHGGRKLNGFLLIVSGGCRYEWEGGEAELGRGDLIYLPSGAKRAVTVSEKPLSFYRISFVLRDAEDGDSFVFSEKPYVATRGAGQKLFDICEKMTKSTLSDAYRLKSTSLLFELFASIDAHGAKKEKSRVAVAVDHIQRHYTEPLDIELLSELCYLSKPHFFKLFKKETGTTPIAMRNSLRIERAKSLLSDDECQIGEISAMLGFESIYYFSRSFKSIVGISPQEYRKG